MKPQIIPSPPTLPSSVCVIDGQSERKAKILSGAEYAVVPYRKDAAALAPTSVFSSFLSRIYRDPATPAPLPANTIPLSLISATPVQIADKAFQILTGKTFHPKTASPEGKAAYHVFQSIAKNDPASLRTSLDDFLKKWERNAPLLLTAARDLASVLNRTNCLDVLSEIERNRATPIKTAFKTIGLASLGAMAIYALSKQGAEAVDPNCHALVLHQPRQTPTNPSTTIPIFPLPISIQSLFTSSIPAYLRYPMTPHAWPATIAKPSFLIQGNVPPESIKKPAVDVNTESALQVSQSSPAIKMSGEEIQFLKDIIGKKELPADLLHSPIGNIISNSIDPNSVYEIHLSPEIKEKFASFLTQLVSVRGSTSKWVYDKKLQEIFDRFSAQFVPDEGISKPAASTNNLPAGSQKKLEQARIDHAALDAEFDQLFDEKPALPAAESDDSWDWDFQKWISNILSYFSSSDTTIPSGRLAIGWEECEKPGIISETITSFRNGVWHVAMKIKNLVL